MPEDTGYRRASASGKVRGPDQPQGRGGYRQPFSGRNEMEEHYPSQPKGAGRSAGRGKRRGHGPADAPMSPIAKNEM